MEPLLPAFLLALVVAVILSPVMARVGHRLGIVDVPGGRRKHIGIVPRLGGVAVVAAFFTAFLVFLPDLAPHFKSKQLLGFSLAAGLLVIVGLLDDKFGVSAKWQLLAQVVAAGGLVLVGMGIDQISSPFGGKIPLDQFQIAWPIDGIAYHLTFPADLLTVVWVVLVINAINWIDGMDGLAGGVGLISAVTLAALSLTTVVGQPHVAVLSLMLAGAILGFLVYNFHPAKIFLGTVGPYFIGFTIATLAIISGGKVATALLVLGFPILDAISLIVRRYWSGRVVWEADATHLHHLLLGKGFSVRQTALIIYAISATFGALALLAGSTGQKALALGLVAVVMLSLLWWVTRPVRT